VCRGLKDIIIGQNPFDVEKIWNDMYTYAFYHGRRSVVIHAMSGIDIALWDIIGKATGQPVCRLLGGRYHDKLRAYASMLMPETEEEVKEKSEEYLKKGFTAIKFGWGGLGISKEQDIRLVRAARQALGDTMLMLDIGYLWKNSKYAMNMCKALEPYDPYWIEEPMICDDLTGFSKLTGSTTLKISSGEELTTLYEFKDLIERGGIDIVQPDISRCGGLTVAKKIADMALLNGIEFVPHAFKSGILMAATVQMLAAYKGDPLLEYCCQETVLSKKLLKKHFEVDRDGYVKVPDAPGLGVEIDLDSINNYRVD
jgi:L-alanine-DL-glutamate epimerase-like enolase superfamily enzyme